MVKLTSRTTSGASRPIRTKCGERGFSVLLLAVSATVLLGMLGLTFDVGRMFIVKSELQTFVDASALAAVKNLDGTSSGITLAHNVSRKKEVAEVLALAEKAGARLVKPAQVTFWGGYSGYFADLDGYYWEVVWAPMCTFDRTGALVFKE